MSPPAPPPSSGPKKNYRCVPALSQFYTGGPFAVSPTGGVLACACGDDIKLVSSSTAVVSATLEGDSETVTAIAFSAVSDRILFSASHSRLIRVWDLDTNKCIRSWKGHDGPVMGMACHASGALLATAGADKKVCVWDVDGGFCTHFFRGHQGIVTNVMFHSDPKRLLLFSGSDDASVRVWSLDNKKCIAVLEEHFSPVTSLALSEDGYSLLSAGRDKVVNVWDLHNYRLRTTVATPEMLETVCVIHPGTVLSSFLGLDNQLKPKGEASGSAIVHFCTVGEHGIVRIWSSDGARCIYKQPSSDATLSSDEEDTRRGFTSAVMMPSDHGLLCVTADQQFLFYCPMKSPEGEFQLNLQKRLVGNNEEIYDMSFFGEEEQYLAVATNLEQVRVFDLATMSCSYVLAGHTDIVVCLDTCLTDSGRSLLVTGSKDKTVRLWDVENRRCIGIGKGHMGDVGAVSFSRKLKNFFVSGSSASPKSTITVWSFDGVTDDADHETKLVSKRVIAGHDKDINSLAVSPNDSLVCSGSEDRTACIWKLPYLEPVVVLKGHKRGVWSVEFSPVDQCVITSSGDKTIKMWAVSDGSCLKTFEGHTASVLRASFLTRGTQIVSCGGDGLVKLWTAKTDECIATYDQHDGKIWALAVGKKTEMLATGGTDAAVNLWHDCTAADKLEAFQREEEAVLRGQELENALSDADYTKAIQLAFELRRPHKLFDLFSQLCRRRDADDPIHKALSSLGKEEIGVLLEYVREWNTKPKLCHIGQFVLFRIFKIFPPSEILEIKGISEVLEGLIPYSQRHFTRIDRLVRSTFLLDYILTVISVIDPEVDTVPSKVQENTLNTGQESKTTASDSQNKLDITSETTEKTPSKKRKSKTENGGPIQTITSLETIEKSSSKKQTVPSEVQENSLITGQESKTTAPVSQNKLAITSETTEKTPSKKRKSKTENAGPIQTITSLETIEKSSSKKQTVPSKVQENSLITGQESKTTAPDSLTKLDITSETTEKTPSKKRKSKTENGGQIQTITSLETIEKSSSKKQKSSKSKRGSEKKVKFVAAE